MAGSLTLKWGTLEGWDGFDDTSLAALQKYADLGMSMGAMQQEMTPDHIEALCEVIDTVDEPINNDWSGEKMTRDEAKQYVREYAQ